LLAIETAPKKQVEKKKEAPTTAKSTIVAEMTEEEKKRAQEEADMAHAAELFGISKPLDEVSLNSREECIDYTNRLYAKLNKFHVNPLSNTLHLNLIFSFTISE
jgi:hypothetical protein